MKREVERKQLRNLRGRISKKWGVGEKAEREVHRECGVRKQGAKKVTDGSCIC